MFIYKIQVCISVRLFLFFYLFNYAKKQERLSHDNPTFI
jgi:hypothetical protein